MEQFKSIRFDSIAMGKLGRIKKKMDDLQEMLKQQIHCGAATYLSPALETAYMYCESAVKKDQLERFKARADSNKEAAKVDRKKKIICIDFDGVLHSYKTGWQGADLIPDKPVDGAISWLETLIESTEFEPCIFSARSGQTGGIPAMRQWLAAYGMSGPYIAKINFPKTKPPAFLTIDDRCLKFTGIFPSKTEIRNFTTWQNNNHNHINMRNQ